MPFTTSFTPRFTWRALEATGKEECQTISIASPEVIAHKILTFLDGFVKFLQ
jgi:hypothetical protein